MQQFSSRAILYGMQPQANTMSYRRCGIASRNLLTARFSCFSPPTTEYFSLFFSRESVLQIFL